MKSASAVLGIFILVGLVVGALVIAVAGKGDSEELKTELAEASAGIDSLATKVNLLEQRISELNKKLDNSLASVEENGRKTDELAGRLAAIEKGPEKTVGARPRGIPDSDPLPAEPGVLTGRPEVLERFKEEVKKELKEERQTEEKERRAKMASQMKDMETKQWRKKLDEEFPKLAEKIGLNTTQELAIQEIAGDAFKKIMALWEEAMSKPESEVDWTAFGENMEKVYKDAAEQVGELVNEEQGKALEKFFED